MPFCLCVFACAFDSMSSKHAHIHTHIFHKIIRQWALFVCRTAYAFYVHSRIRHTMFRYDTHNADMLYLRRTIWRMRLRHRSLSQRQPIHSIHSVHFHRQTFANPAIHRSEPITRRRRQAQRRRRVAGD